MKTPTLSAGVGAVLAGGIALRIAQYLNGRPIWLDEALLTLNILVRPLLGFFVPLDRGQMSTLGFLWAEWLVTRIAGPDELALRLVSFAAGVAALILFARLARRVLEPPAALVALVFAALSPLLLVYSAEVKSYQLDALTAILLILVSLEWVESPSARNAWRWALAGAAAALLSTPAPFTVGGSALALALLPTIRRDPRAMRRLALMGVPAALLVLLQMLTLYNTPQLAARYSYWGTSFLPLELSGAVAGLFQATKELWFELLFGGNLYGKLSQPLVTATVVLSVIGFISLARRNRLTAALLAAPMLLAVAAALAQRWPLTPRLLLFGAPLVFITVAAGLAAVAQAALARARLPVLAVAAGGVIWAAGIGVASELRNPANNELLPSVMDSIGSRHEPKATVYVASLLVPACEYYSVWHTGRTRRVGDSAAQQCTIRGATVVPGRGGDRIEANPRPVGGDGLIISEAWVAAERERVMMAASGGRLWLVVRLGIETSDVIRSAIEGAGAIPVGVEHRSTIGVYEYQVPIQPRPDSTSLSPPPSPRSR